MPIVDLTPEQTYPYISKGNSQQSPNIWNGQCCLGIGSSMRQSVSDYQCLWLVQTLYLIKYMKTIRLMQCRDGICNQHTCMTCKYIAYRIACPKPTGGRGLGQATYRRERAQNNKVCHTTLFKLEVVKSWIGLFYFHMTIVMFTFRTKYRWILKQTGIDQAQQRSVISIIACFHCYNERWWVCHSKV